MTWNEQYAILSEDLIGWLCDSDTKRWLVVVFCWVLTLTTCWIIIKFHQNRKPSGLVTKQENRTKFSVLIRVLLAFISLSPRSLFPASTNQSSKKRFHEREHEDKEPNWQIMLHFVLHHSVVNMWLPLEKKIWEARTKRSTMRAEAMVINLHDPVIFLSLEQLTTEISCIFGAAVLCRTMRFLKRLNASAEWALKHLQSAADGVEKTNSFLH